MNWKLATKKGGKAAAHARRRIVQAELLESRLLLAADIFEPNDSFAQAADLGQGDRYHNGLTIHQSENDDWYKWTPFESGSLTVETFFEHARGDLDLELYDSSQDQLDISQTTDDNESVSSPVNWGEYYFIRVFGYAGATHDDYDLYINGQPSTQISPDPFEDNDTAATAADLGTGDQTHKSLTLDYDQIEGVVDPHDWFTWTASADGTLTVDVLFRHALGDIDVRLLDDTQSFLDDSTSGTDDEQVSANVTRGEAYFIHVYGFNDTSSPGYDLVIDGPDILPDIYEPNDDFAAASDLGQGDQSHSGLTIHEPGNEDWFKWTASAYGTLTVNVLFAHAQGDIDVQLQGADQGLLDFSNSIDDNEHVSSEVFQGETYFLRVYGHAGATHGGYNLVIDGPEILPDAFEPNDEFAAAFDLGQGDQIHTGLTIHEPGNEDWFKWTATADGTLTVDVLFAHARGDIDVELQDADQGVLYVSNSSDDNEHVSSEVFQGETYFLRVYGWAGSTNPDYTLVIDGPDLLPDLIVTDLWESEGFVAYQIRNIGEGPAPPGHYATLSVDDATVTEELVPVELQPDQRWRGTFDWPISIPGDAIEVVVLADHGDQVAEINEANNFLAEIWAGDVVPPDIGEGPWVLDITPNSARVVWTTSEASNSVVRFGEHAARYDRVVSESDLVLSHDVVLDGLTPATTYVAVVETTDAADNLTTSDPFTFSTAPLADDIPPEVTISTPGTISDVIVISAEASDNQEVARVEFYLDDQLAHIDYSPPYNWEFDPGPYDNGPYVITTQAFDAAGQSSSDQQTVDVAKLVDQEAPVVTITTPLPDETVSGQVTVRADLSDDAGLQVVQFYADGVYSGFKGFPTHPKTATVEFTWDSTTFAASQARLGMQLFDIDGKSALDTVDVYVENLPPPPPPKLIVTGHTATRNGNYLDVELKVRNVGPGEAQNVLVFDTMQGFHPAWNATQNPLATYTGSHTPSSQWSTCEITTLSNLASGQEYVYQYSVLPVMSYPNQPMPSIGSSIELSYEDQGGTDFSDSFNLPITHTFTNVPIATAHANALKQADYLITTNPQYLHWQYSTQGSDQAEDVDELLTEMAKLAEVKEGALGFFYSDHNTTRSTLHAFTKPGGAWAKRMHDDFSDFSGFIHTLFGAGSGYMLIVGETEIMPSWPSRTFASQPDDPVPYSDSPYADTGGIGGLPDLIVGRVIGDSADALKQPISAAIGVYEGYPLSYFDRDEALVISDPTPGDFKERAEDRATQLQNNNFTVSRMHWRDYYLADFFSRNFDAQDGFDAGDIVGGSSAEIVLADESQRKVYLYDAGGHQLAQFSVPWWQGVSSDGLAVGDVDGDGKAEVVLADSSHNQIYMYESNGGHSQFSFAFDAYDVLTTGDVDADGDHEIIIGDISDNKIYTYLSSGTLHSSFTFADGFDKLDGLVAADVEGNSQAEILLADWSAKRLHVFTSTGGVRGWADLPGSGKSSDHPRLLAGAGRRFFVAAGGTHIYAYDWDPISAQHPHGRLLGRGVVPIEDLSPSDGLAIGNVADYRGNTVTEEILFADQSNQVQVIDPHDGHFKAKVREQLPGLVAQQDVIHYDGHGEISRWDGGINSHADPHEAVFPMDFDNHHPVVTTAYACKTGNYEDGHREHQNIAEAFFDSGAGAYIGATHDGISASRALIKQFYDLFPAWDMLSVGYAWTIAERDQWYGHSSNKAYLDSNDFGYSVWEFNVYGDPKYGMTKPTGSADATPPESEPPTTLDVEIPDYVVSERAGLDFVEIPGGKMWYEEGQLWLPYYTENIDIPPGYEPLDVIMTDRSGLVTDTGLDVPVNPEEFTLNLAEYLPNPGTQAWFPEVTYDWRAVENADGSSTLVVFMFPFRYNSRTTDLEYYQNYSFDISYLVSPVEITGIVTDRAEYGPGETVNVDLALSNSEEAQGVVVEAVVFRHGTDEIVDGLLLETLDGLAGNATFLSQWDTADVEAGYYSVEVTLTDTSHRILDRDATFFRVGNAAVDVTNFTVTPDVVVDGTQSIDVAMVVQNTGLEEIASGAAIIEIFSSAGVRLLASERDITGLLPSASAGIEESLDISQRPLDSYTVLAYVQHDGLTTEPIVREVRAHVEADPDFNTDGLLDCQDINALTAEIVAGTNNAAYDLTGDGLVDVNDRDFWLAAAGAVNLPSGNAYLMGDATLDGNVDVLDFNRWNMHKFQSVAEWCAGDFTADGNVDVLDFNQWNMNKFQSSDGAPMMMLPPLAVAHFQFTSPRFPVANDMTSEAAPQVQRESFAAIHQQQLPGLAASIVDKIFSRMNRAAASADSGYSFVDDAGELVPSITHELD